MRALQRSQRQPTSSSTEWVNDADPAQLVDDEPTVLYEKVEGDVEGLHAYEGEQNLEESLVIEHHGR